ncbi:MAG TPA: anaerobic sulfatase-maturation protein [Patescibacteria group bacterium]|nr:anaerobic sulfatase-maturation protein [Patescibacteria group bacterium]
MISSLPVSLNLLMKPVGPRCNLRCDYCYYLEKSDLYAGKPVLTMPDELIENFIREFSAAQSGACIRFDWHGGEPTLLDPDIFRKIVRWQKKYAGSRRVANSLQTNGTLLTHEWCNFFRENGFLIGISLDGPEHIHDRYRRDAKGQSTFARVMQGVELLQSHQVEFNTLSVVNDYSSRYPLEIYRFFKEIGSHYLQFSPVVERLIPTTGPAGQRLASPGDRENAVMAPWSVDPLLYGRFLSAIFDEWILTDVGNYYVVTFDAVLAKWCGVEPPNCALADVCGNGAVMEADGDIYVCDHYVYPEYRLGNVRKQSLASLLLSDRQTEFGRQKTAALPEACRQCEHLRICAGECPKHRIVQTTDGMLNYLCPGLKFFLSHTAPYMAYMKKQIETDRAPADVMTWARIRRAGENSD